MRILRENDFFHSEQHAFCLFSMNNQLMEGVHGHDFDELVIVRSGRGFILLMTWFVLSARVTFF